MKFITGAFVVIFVYATAATTVALSGPDSDSVWLLVVCATVLPTMAALGSAQKGRRVGGREGAAWKILAVSMGLMIPIYYADSVGAYGVEDLLIAAAYAVGAIAIVVVPLPNAGPYQRIVASLDAVGIGVVVAIATFWLVSGSRLDVAGHTLWVIADAVIMAMVGYVAVRRSQRAGVDWPLLVVIVGVACYLTGVLITSIGEEPYYIGHEADYVYFLGMAAFALAPFVRERQREAPQNILEPVRWGHVLGPYLLVAVLTVALVANGAATWGDDPVGTMIELGLLATMILVLVRQLAMIAEQRHKIRVDQNGVIATISHELRTPLTTVVGFLDLLEDWDGYSEAEKLEMVAMMRDQSHVLARVVGDLIDVARERIERLDLEVTGFRARPFLEEVVANVPELTGVDVRIDVAPGTVATADGDRLAQILVNYLSNAGQYGAGCVQVVCFDTGTETVIEVHDDGPGVPDIYRQVIWERFERGSQRQSAIPGSGIGLSLARGIAHSHGGEVAYRQSEMLAGACFSVTIPLRPGLSPALRSVPSPSGAAVE